MGNVLKDLTNKRFGRWVVIERLPDQKRNLRWLCKCDCGTVKSVAGTALKSGKSTGCRSCMKATHVTHGLSNTHLYGVWSRIKGCTTNPNHHDYKWYGGRGIQVCAEWFNDFERFYTWAITHGYKQGLTIERLNCDGNYSPDNCTWITIQDQQWNKHPKGYLEDAI